MGNPEDDEWQQVVDEEPKFVLELPLDLVRHCTEMISEALREHDRAQAHNESKVERRTN